MHLDREFLIDKIRDLADSLIVLPQNLFLKHLIFKCSNGQKCSKFWERQKTVCFCILN